MFRKIFTNYKYTKIKGKRIKDAENDSVTDRQEIISGYDQQALEQATVTCIGAGGIVSEVGEGLVRKGIGCMKIFDSDEVERSNLNRQLYFKRDLYKSKGLRLARNLAQHSTRGSTLIGYDLMFQDAVEVGVEMECDIAICGVDNTETRVDVSRYFRKFSLPVIFIAVDRVAESGYVFVQEPGQACFGCAFPKSLQNTRMPCRTPAVKDVLKVVAGLSLYAIDTLLMDRKRGWNFRNVHLAGFAPSNELMINKNPDCPLCGERKSR